MSSTASAEGAAASTDRRRYAAVGLCLGIAVLYGLIWSGAVPAIDGAEPGDRAILGVAGVLFVLLAGLLWWVRHRALWVATILLQLAMIAMYVAVGAEREPPFELWGLAVRVLQVVLIVVLASSLVTASRGRRPGRGDE